jgi:hypothetical protein
MEAKELRIGNLISEEVLGTCEVNQILENCLMVSVPTGKLDGTIGLSVYTLNYDCVTGIPLTEEWLLKFNADKHDGFYSYHRFKLLWKPLYGYWYVIDLQNWTYLTKVEFVHEWQNFVFVMNGEELNSTN